jgi:hypothetical protein
MDGLLTKAKKSCPFSYYAFRFQQDSQVCMDKKGKEASKKLFLMLCNPSSHANSFALPNV